MRSQATAGSTFGRQALGSVREGCAVTDAVPVRGGRDGPENRAGLLRRVMPIVCCVLVTFAGFAAPAYAATVTVALWKMNESAGSTKMLDSSGNNLIGDISSAVLVGQPGQGSYGYRFIGNGGIVTVPTATKLNPVTGPFTVALSFKSSTHPSAGNDFDLIRKGLGTTSGGDWKMEVEPNGNALCHFRGSAASIDLIGWTDVVNSAWHRLECRYTTTGTALVVDGVTQNKSTAHWPGTISNSSSLTIGAKTTDDDMTIGVLDQVTITKG